MQTGDARKELHTRCRRHSHILVAAINRLLGSDIVDHKGKFAIRARTKTKLLEESPKCGALYYADRVRKEFPEFDVRVSILGHLQRGGRPSARDRILASRTGCGAIEAIMQGQRNVMIGVRNNEVVYVPLSEAIRSDKPFDRKLIKVLDELSI